MWTDLVEEVSGVDLSFIVLIAIIKMTLICNRLLHIILFYLDLNKVKMTCIHYFGTRLLLLTLGAEKPSSSFSHTHISLIIIIYYFLHYLVTSTTLGSIQGARIKWLSLCLTCRKHRVSMGRERLSVIQASVECCQKCCFLYITYQGRRKLWNIWKHCSKVTKLIDGFVEKHVT